MTATRPTVPPRMDGPRGSAAAPVLHEPDLDSPTVDDIPDLDFRSLAALLTGDVHLPGTPAYGELGTPWNRSVPSRPCAVVAVASAADVRETVLWAAEAGVQVAVRTTGHGAVDPLDGILLIHTGRLTELTVSPDGSCRAGAGTLWGAVNAAAAPLGLAPLGGSAPTVGVVGLLTGGGVGPLARTYGVCSDRVTAVEVVTGDGRIRRATAETETDLFWALRGGKGALGIVTAIEFDLLPLTTVLAGSLFFGSTDTARVLHEWARWCVDLPLEATTSVAVLRLPPMQGVPAPIAGKQTVAVRFVWTGDPAEGEQVLAPMRSVAPLVFGGVQVMPAAGVGVIYGDPVDPMPSHDRCAVLSELPREAIDTILDVAGPTSDCTQLVVELRQLGGRITATPTVPSAFCGRDAPFTLRTIGITAGPRTGAIRADAAAIITAAQPWTTARRLPNFEPSTDPATLSATYDPDTLRRLRSIVADVDPRAVISTANLLRP